ncbi:hypothetical protein C8R45DRAFT_1004392, partial [Mycena sanguinolenta]
MRSIETHRLVVGSSRKHSSSCKTALASVIRKLLLLSTRRVVISSKIKNKNTQNAYETEDPPGCTRAISPTADGYLLAPSLVLSARLVVQARSRPTMRRGHARQPSTPVDGVEDDQDSSLLDGRHSSPQASRTASHNRRQEHGIQSGRCQGWSTRRRRNPQQSQTLRKQFLQPQLPRYRLPSRRVHNGALSPAGTPRWPRARF